MLLYRFFSIILTPFVALLLFYRIFKGKEDKQRIWERFGFSNLPRPKNKKLIWIHAASIGESMSALPLLNKLTSPDTRILFTSGTLTSAKILANLLPKNVIHQFFVAENWFAIRKFLKHWQPDLAIFIESEFWPLILSETSKHCKIISLNTSISDKSLIQIHQWSWLRNSIINSISLFLPQSKKDLKNLESLKVGFKSRYLGHLKYCAPALRYNQQSYDMIEHQIQGQNIILFASFHPEEDQAILEIYQKLSPKTKHNLLCLIAPRYPKCSTSLTSLLKLNNLSFSLRSAQDKITKNTQFYIADTLGELGLFYKLSPITVMGGTFAKIGGHNIIEPLKLKSVVITGPDVSEIKEIHQELLEAQAIIHNKTTSQIAQSIEQLLSDKQLRTSVNNNADKIIKSKEKLLDQFVTIIKDEL